MRGGINQKKNRICPFYRDNLRINENPRGKKEHKVSSNSAVRIYLCVTTSIFVTHLVSNIPDKIKRNFEMPDDHRIVGAYRCLGMLVSWKVGKVRLSFGGIINFLRLSNAIVAPCPTNVFPAAASKIARVHHSTSTTANGFAK